jgi:hypothetical protein
LAGDYESIALLSYGLGYPLDEVRDAFSKAAQAFIKVFELRGTEDAFPAYILTYNPSLPPQDPVSSTLEPLHPPGTKDYSLTNSNKNYRAVCEALIAGEDELAAQLASFIGDPPNEDYIGPRSFCTPNDQRLAYALRELYQGGHDAVERELKGIRLAKKIDLHYRYQANMIRALATGNGPLFLEGLASLLDWHRQQAPSKRNRLDPHFFICIPALGLCRLAVQRKLCTDGEFPQDDVFLPLELIQSMKTQTSRSSTTWE